MIGFRLAKIHYMRPTGKNFKSFKCICGKRVVVEAIYLYRSCAAAEEEGEEEKNIITKKKTMIGALTFFRADDVTKWRE